MSSIWIAEVDMQTQTHLKHTWYLHSIHIDFLDKIYQPESLCYLCRCYIFTLPPEIMEKIMIISITMINSASIVSFA